MALYLNGKKLSGEPHNYSTDEQVVGTWIDGSTLYEKTINCGTLPNASVAQIAHNIANLSEVVHIFGYAINSSYTSLPLPFSGTALEYNISVSADTTYISITTGRDRTSFNGYVTIRYTKTT